MSNEQILTKAIQKAAGYNISTPHFVHPLEEYEWEDNKRYWFLGDITIPLFEIIYQHDFAKALWGNTIIGCKLSKKFSLTSDGEGWKNEGADENSLSYDISGPKWQVYLMQMVIADDPIAYLGEHLE